jgi:Flp pilus assembly protein TadD
VLARAFTDAFKHDQAILQLRQAVQAAPGNASLRMELALELQSDAQAEKALKELTEAVRLAPEDGRPHAMRAAILLNSQQIDEAVEELRIAVRLEPRNAAYESVLGRALASQIGRVNEAAAAFEAAARLKPGEDGALNEPGMVTSLRDGAQDATRALRADVQQNANSVDAHLRLGVALAATGDLDAAQTEFQRGIELEPKNGMAHLAMARLHYLRGDYAAAGAEIESAKAFGAKPNSAFASVVQRKLGR